MDLDFKISKNKNDTIDGIEMFIELFETHENLRFNNKYEKLKVCFKSNHQVNYDISRKFDFLICINSIENLKNLPFIESISLVVWGHNFYQRYEIVFGEEIFAPLYCVTFGRICLEVIYSDTKYTSEAEDILCCCDFGLLQNNVRNNVQLRCEYVDNYVNLKSREYDL